MYDFFPDLGPLLNKALQGESPQEAEQSLVAINQKYFSERKGTYTSIQWKNPANGREFTLNIYDVGGQFQKDNSNRYSVEVTWQAADFVR